MTSLELVMPVLTVRDLAAALGGRFHDPVDTEYGLREGAHIDPGGKLLRVGSWLLGRRPA